MARLCRRRPAGRRSGLRVVPGADQPGPSAIPPHQRSSGPLAARVGTSARRSTRQRAGSTEIEIRARARTPAELTLRRPASGQRSPGLLAASRRVTNSSSHDQDQLAHILRAAARITDDGDILVIGSRPSSAVSTRMNCRTRPTPRSRSMSRSSTTPQSSGRHGSPSLSAKGRCSTRIWCLRAGRISDHCHLAKGWLDRVVPFPSGNADPAKSHVSGWHMVLVIAKPGDVDSMSTSWRATG